MKKIRITEGQLRRLIYEIDTPESTEKTDDHGKKLDGSQQTNVGSDNLNKQTQLSADNADKKISGIQANTTQQMAGLMYSVAKKATQGQTLPGEDQNGQNGGDEGDGLNRQTQIAVNNDDKKLAGVQANTPQQLAGLMVAAAGKASQNQQMQSEMKYFTKRQIKENRFNRIIKTSKFYRKGDLK